MFVILALSLSPGGVAADPAHAKRKRSVIPPVARTRDDPACAEGAIVSARFLQAFCSP